MAETILELEARRDAIQAARDTGTVKFVYAGREQTYRSLSEMDRVIADLTRRLSVLPGSDVSLPPTVRNARLKSTKGL